MKTSRLANQLRSVSTKSRIPWRQKTWVPPAYPRMPSGVPSFAASPFYTYKIRNKILAGGKTILFGNNVSEHFNRTRRIWRPNIKIKSLWSDALGRRIRLRMVTNVLRTVDKVGGLDAYLTCTTRARMKELGPRGWEIRSAVIKSLRGKERAKHMRMFQRSILLYPQLRMDSQWKDIRPYIRHTEGYAVLPEEHCKKAFAALMERLREGRPVVRRQGLVNRPIILSRTSVLKLVRRTKRVQLSNTALKTRVTPKQTSTLASKRVRLPAAVPKSKKSKHRERKARQKRKAQMRGERRAKAKQAMVDRKRKAKALLS